MTDEEARRIKDFALELIARAEENSRTSLYANSRADYDRSIGMIKSHFESVIYHEFGTHFDEILDEFADGLNAARQLREIERESEGTPVDAPEGQEGEPQWRGTSRAPGGREGHPRVVWNEPTNEPSPQDAAREEAQRLSHAYRAAWYTPQPWPPVDHWPATEREDEEGPSRYMRLRAAISLYKDANWARLMRSARSVGQLRTALAPDRGPVIGSAIRIEDASQIELSGVTVTMPVKNTPLWVSALATVGALAIVYSIGVKRGWWE